MKRTPVRPSLKPIARRKRMRRSRPHHFSREDEEFLAKLRGERCVVALALGSTADCRGVIEPAHYKGGTARRFLAVIGNTFPCCSGHHRFKKLSYHEMGRDSFQRHFQLNLLGLCESYARKLAA